jgi:hypothetical protein
MSSPIRKPLTLPASHHPSVVQAARLPEQPSGEQRDHTTPPLPQNNSAAFAQVDLGPPLPIGVYACHETWNPERIGALALYCSDGRWGEAFDEFCHKRLLLPRYDRWAVPGGPAWLVPRDTGGELYQATRTQLDFLIRVHELERIVLITHYGCAYYRELLRQPPDACVATQLGDLHTAQDALHRWFPDIQVETYLAMQRGKCISFHHELHNAIGGQR